MGSANFASRKTTLHPSDPEARHLHPLPGGLRLVPRRSARLPTRSREGNELRLINYRDTTPMNAGQVDDSPYGGGAGMVLRVDVVDAALEAAYGAERPRIVLLIADRAAARRRDRRRAGRRAARGAALRSLRGLRRPRPPAPRRRRALDRPLRPRRRRAAGDGRRRRADAQAARARSATRTRRVEESFSHALEGMPEYPHYTRPPSYRGWEVPGGPALRRPRQGPRVAPGAEPGPRAYAEQCEG